MANSRGRRKARRMLQEAGLWPPPKRLAPPPAEQHAPFWKRIVAGLSGLLALFATLVTLAYGYPWLSIEEGGLLDSNNPYSELWTVTNHGIPIWPVEALCITSFTTSRGLSVQDNRFITSVALYLGHEQSATAPCFNSAEVHPGGQRQRLVGASIDDTVRSGSLIIIVSYGILGLKRWPRHQTFHYVSVQGADNILRWQKLSP
jgi:hypothetical protein